jgi:hypothetical protein
MLPDDLPERPENIPHTVVELTEDEIAAVAGGQLTTIPGGLFSFTFNTGAVVGAVVGAIGVVSGEVETPSPPVTTV